MNETSLANTRNFCIIAHIDHGKTTLSDRILELTKAIDQRLIREQTLDAMDLERERGITIKSHPVSMNYTAKDGGVYRFNLIDTPGHVDFAYEVSRSMRACEGAILVVDATQGVEAQTVANTYLAVENNLEIVVALNKVDMPGADPEGVSKQIEDLVGIPKEEHIRISAKTGLNVDLVLEEVVKKIPPPKTVASSPLRALVFDSRFDIFRGVVIYLRVMEGTIKPSDSVMLMSNGISTQIREVGIFSPEQKPVEILCAGDVGYIVGTIKDPKDVKNGDTITTAKDGADEPLPGYTEVRPMVFSGIYPVGSEDFEKVRQGLEKLHLNDPAFTYHPESSVALGFGFRCGFLGLLHMEIVQERLRREFDLDIINTHPSVVYRVVLTGSGDVLEVDNPVKLPDVTRIDRIEEPIIKATIICPGDKIGDIMRLVTERRGEIAATESVDAKRVMITATLPLNEILIDFHDSLKSISRGYASMDYEPHGYRESDIVKLDVLLNGECVDAFSSMVHRDKAVSRGRQMCKSLADTIPPHMFKIPVQAAIGRTIIAREDIKPFRKDVLAKLYGGDVTRKQKVLKKQKEGKKRMKEFGQVNVPQSAFIAVLKGSGGEER